MKVFVAGATGVLGRRLVRQLTERGHVVIGLARNSKNEETIRRLGAEARRADLFEADSLARAAAGADVVVHAATAIPAGARQAPQDWEMNDRIRRDGTHALAAAAAKAGAKLFLAQSIVWVARPADQSSFDEDSPPHPAESNIKSTADLESIAREAAEKHGFRAAILRCGWFYSPDASHTRLFGHQLTARKLPIIGKGDAIWSWIHVDDAAGAFVAAAEAGKAGLWHVVDNEPVESGAYLREFARRLQAAPPRRVPAWLARMVGGSQTVNFMTASTRTSNARFRRDFAWSPQYPTYREGLDNVISAWRAENFLGLENKQAA
ncbi:MAG TPA: NAD(P)-dependent oxidoreductase [Candidatus Acidoferrales bacterium]|nr:NAD(P)-dependent oxidoreductase [Candidatus Acidoferrales bacterium]